MSSEIKDILLMDNEAQRLFEQFRGIDTRDRSNIQDRKAEVKDDPWRAYFVKTALLLKACFEHSKLLEGRRGRQDVFIRILKNLSQLSKIPDSDRVLLIRYRGSLTTANIPDNIDYVMRFGHVMLDNAIGARMGARMGEKMSDLKNRLANIFTTFAENSIGSLSLTIPESSPKQLEFFRVSLRIMTLFPRAAAADQPVEFESGGKKIRIPLIKDENGLADPNLTLTAAINRIRPKAMQDLMAKVGIWMNRPEAKKSGDDMLGIYNSMFRIENLKAKLIMPPIEMNNVKWLMLDKDRHMVSRQQAGLTKIIAAKYPTSPEKAARTIRSVYGDDYGQIDPVNLVGRINSASKLLTSIEKTPDSDQMETEVIENIQGRFRQIDDEVLDELKLAKNSIHTLASGKSLTIKPHARLLKMIVFFKRRSVTKRKMKNLFSSDTVFEKADYQAIAEDFEISEEAAKQLVGLLRGCFDKEGHFLRKVFESNIPEFCKHEGKVFIFLWHYLKETLHRGDRVAFLNALQQLIIKMKQPARAIGVILADFLSRVHDVSFSDRNAIMLANLLVRKYNKELRLDIEITPEEVLLVKDGMDDEVVHNTVIMIEGIREQVIQKCETIHEKLRHSLFPGARAEKPMPLRYMLSIEREVCIFLSLIGGKTSYEIVRQIFIEYGNPVSDIYSLKGSRQNLSILLQHLKILVRCFGRLATSNDMQLLDSLTRDENRFLQMSDDSLYADKVRRIMTWTESAKNNLSKGLIRENRDTGGFIIMN